MKTSFLKAEDESKRFRLSYAKVFLTYKTHIDKEKLLEFFKSKRPVKWWIICHENADEEDAYEHTHACIEFQSRPDWTATKCMDFEGIHPHIGQVRKWGASVQYCRKEDSNPLCNIPQEESIQIKINKIMSAESDREALNNASRLSDIVPILNLRKTCKNGVYITKRAREKFQNATLRGCQPDIEKLILESGDRDILWFFEPGGNVGKTFITKYMAVHHGCIPFAGSGGIANYIYTLAQYIMAGDEPDVVLVDLPRTMCDRKNVYSLIEMVKNGLVTNEKYISGCLVFIEPKVCVFANVPPDTERLSHDRWKIFEIKEQGTCLAAVTLEAARQFWENERLNEENIFNQ